MRISSMLVSLVALSVFLSAPTAYAVSSQPAKFSHGTVSLFTDASSIQPGSDFVVGVHFVLEPRWHIYWVNSGDSGEPPKIDWQLPKGISVGQIMWPTPSKLGSATVVDFGYEKDATLLVHMHADSSVAPTASATFGANVRVLICSNMCLPSRASASLAVPVRAQAPAPDPSGATMMREARQHLPEPAPQAWKFSAIPTKDSFVINAKTTERIVGAQFFPLEPSQIDNAAPQILRPEPAGFQLTLHKSDELTGSISHLKGVLVIPGGEAYEIDAPVQKSGG
jgi:DsbC/DsbD-like thiol-disulfide interchange protein